MENNLLEVLEKQPTGLDVILLNFLPFIFKMQALIY